MMIGVGKVDCSGARDGLWGVVVPVSWVVDKLEESEKEIYAGKEKCYIGTVLGFDEEVHSECSQCFMIGSSSEHLWDKLGEVVDGYLKTIGVVYGGTSVLSGGPAVVLCSRDLSFGEAEGLAKWLADGVNW